MALVNRLFVIPTADTMQYLKELLSPSHIEAQWDPFHVDIITTQDALETEPTIVYHAQAGSIGSYYDSSRMQASLLLPLTSRDMSIRFEQLCANGVIPKWYPQCKPYMSLLKDSPPLSRKTRGWINSVSDALVARTKMQPLEFTAEFVSTENQESPLNFDFLRL